MNCRFCFIDKSKKYNEILEETKYFYITPTLGSLVDGYILIISKRHINSMTLLNEEELNEYKYLINKYRNKFKNIYKKYPIIFEHGTTNLNSNFSASSVVHAHTHIINYNFYDEDNLIKNTKFKIINKLEEISKNKNYILYINQNNKKYISYEFPSISQYMRMCISKELNILNKYDWHDNYFENNINLTINKIKEIGESDEENYK